MSDEPDIEYEIVGNAQERMNRRKVRASERYWEREYREVLSRLKEAEAELADLRQVTDAKFWRHEGEIHDLRARLADWQRHGVKVTENCETCEGGTEYCKCEHHVPGDTSNGCLSPHAERPCPDCGGTGKKPRDGVEMTAYDGGGVWSKWSGSGRWYVIPAEWLEAE